MNRARVPAPLPALLPALLLAGAVYVASALSKSEVVAEIQAAIIDADVG